MGLGTRFKEQDNHFKTTSIHEVIIVDLFLVNLSISVFILMAINFTQKHTLCPKEYRGKEI